jgi:hypothetical protein
MTGPKTQTYKDKGPKTTDGECISYLELKEMMRALTKAFESHTINADSSPLGLIYPSFSSFDENIANEYNECEVSMDNIFHDVVYVIAKIEYVAITLIDDSLVW